MRAWTRAMVVLGTALGCLAAGRALDGPPVGVKAHLAEPDGGWDEMALRGAACKAAIRIIHQADLVELRRAAAWLIWSGRAPEGTAERALLELVTTGQGPMPARAALWPRGLQPNGLGRVQWLEPVADWPDSWDRHPDHPRNPANWDPWVVTLVQQEPQVWLPWIVQAMVGAPAKQVGSCQAVDLGEPLMNPARGPGRAYR